MKNVGTESKKKKCRKNLVRNQRREKSTIFWYGIKEGHFGTESRNKIFGAESKAKFDENLVFSKSALTSSLLGFRISNWDFS